MDWKDISGTVGKVAPILGTLLGGQAGGAVGALVASALGVANDADSVNAAIVGNPDAVIKLRELEANKAIRLQELAVQAAATELQTAAADRDSARRMQVGNKSPMPAILTCGTGLGFFVTLWALFRYPIPAENRDLIVYMCGQLAVAFAACLAFWVGTTRQSEDKTHLLAQSQPVK